jgi:hypothetical protein
MKISIVVRVLVAVIAFAMLPAAALASALETAASPTPDVPSPVLCLVEAPTFERLNAAVNATPAPGTPVVTPTPGIVPAGTPADPVTVDGIKATVRELVACFNAGEPLRSFGLYTDAYLNILFNRQGGFSQAVYDSYATPEPVADATRHTAILEIAEVRVFADGSAGATVTMRYASIPVPKTFYISFLWNGERWMISDVLGEISFSVP